MGKRLFQAVHLPLSVIEIVFRSTEIALDTINLELE